MELIPRGPELIAGVVPDDYRPPESTPQTAITALAFFLSLDLSGSTALKTRSDDWAEIIRYFYGQTVEQVHDAEPTFRVWKYIGDEVAFYAFAPSLTVLPNWVSSGFRCERSILAALERKFPAVKSRISIKGISWIAPITGYVAVPEALDPATMLELKRSAADLKAKDLMFRDIRGNVDFIGPNIDAGFRLARFARPLQLTVSPALAYYFLRGAKRTNDLRIVGFESLKGVAKGELYPAIWYHENWERVGSDFRYTDRFTDDIVQRVCAGRHESIELLDEVKIAFGDDYYFFEVDMLERLVKASVPFISRLA